MRYARIAALVAVAGFAVWSAYSGDIVDLRRGGQQAVDDLFSSGASDALLDRVCAQKDCRASRLFWYTDLEEAKLAAHRLGRPILSLRLLGRLDEELSCANSRFFRVMLYSDESIASILRERYVLHWSSERPVPQVTIDMGDGRKIRQTITGNSVHYLLDEDGNVLDALPGLYSPAAFRMQIAEWLSLDRSVLRTYHSVRSEETASRALDYGIAEVRTIRGRRPAAEQAAPRAMTKSLPETPMLAALSLGARRMLPQEWMALGEKEIDSVTFSDESLALMQRKQTLNEELLRNLRRTVAIDTIYNEYELHRRIHEWFAMGQVRDLATLNERIYDELFLTPSNDPWLGLKPEAVFTAIASE